MEMVREASPFTDAPLPMKTLTLRMVEQVRVCTVRGMNGVPSFNSIGSLHIRYDIMIRLDKQTNLTKLFVLFNLFFKGTLSMANAGPNTNGSQCKYPKMNEYIHPSHHPIITKDYIHAYLTHLHCFHIHINILIIVQFSSATVPPLG
jgi:hypothetical protein